MTHRDHLLPNVGTLGKKVERRKSEPIRQDEEVAPGIFKDAEGRLYTCRPENELANIPVYDWKFIK
jgi:hypothetical protein